MGLLLADKKQPTANIRSPDRKLQLAILELRLLSAMVRATPETEISETNDHNDTTSQEQQWRTDIRQAVAETRDTSTLASKCRDLHLRMVSTLTEIGAAQLSNTQTLKDDVYAQILPKTETSQATRQRNRLGRRNPKPKQAARGKAREIDMLERKISSIKIRTYWPGISARGCHG